MVLRANAALPCARTYLAWADGRPVVLAGFDLEEDGDAGLAFVTAPDARRRGLAAAALRLLLAHPDAGGVRRFRAGVEAGNHASAALLGSLGFRPEGGPDAEGFTCFARPGPAAA